jgi:membrane protein CcdC involved in cytochrome C biogenesis
MWTPFTPRDSSILNSPLSGGFIYEHTNIEKTFYISIYKGMYVPYSVALYVKYINIEKIF